MNYPLIFAENQRIETERLILRPVTLADAGICTNMLQMRKRSAMCFEKPNNR